jgi:hypothetical protein
MSQLALAATIVIAQPRVVSAQLQLEEPRSQPRFWQAAAGVAGINLMVWGYDWYVQRWPWANVGLRAWTKNFHEGFVWDDDDFLDNQLAHPYQGSLYMASARGSGYGFWGSLPFVVGGSFTWELMGENIRPSLNDFITTTMGGAAMGEAMFRMGSMLWSGGKQPGPGRELAGFVISPVGRVQDLIHPTAEQSGTSNSAQNDFQIRLGRQADRALIQFHVAYGDFFAPEFHHPYDAFRFDVEVGPTGGPDVRRVGISGLLARHTLRSGARDEVILGLFQHYDYQRYGALESGGQSLGGALLYRHQLGIRNRVDLGIYGDAVLLGGISSDHNQFWRRDYDLGVGPAGRFNATFTRDGWDYLHLDSRLEWLHSVHGSDGDHVTTFVRVAAAIPVRAGFGLGGDLAVAARHSHYPTQPEGRQQMSQLRAYMLWMP